MSIRSELVQVVSRLNGEHNEGDRADKQADITTPLTNAIPRCSPLNRLCPKAPSIFAGLSICWVPH